MESKEEEATGILSRLEKLLADQYEIKTQRIGEGKKKSGEMKKNHTVKVKVRRTQLPVAPANFRTVYGAQGEGANAVVVDMKRPPREHLCRHWLALCVMVSRPRTLGCEPGPLGRHLPLRFEAASSQCS